MKKLTNFLFTFLMICTSLYSTAQITSPKAHFGFAIGDDYHLANFQQTESYFKQLATESDRISYKVIGKTEEGRDQCMLIVTSPKNHKQLAKYKSIAQTLARAEIQEQEAKTLAEQGKAIVWIDGGLHSNEMVAMHQLIQIAYLLANENDKETLDILDNTIILLAHANPDGQELIANWYMRESIPEKRSLSYVPKLYQKYAGHDNNRDFFMLNLKESQNIARQLFIEWNPQIMYNHHQTAPAGAVVAGAPYRDPFNYVFDPLVIAGIESLGAAMSSRLYAENKPGYTQRGGSVFSTWYNGGLRTTTYFHNTIGLLTEIIGGPNPFEIPLVTSRLLPNSNTHNPVLPQTWHFNQSIAYSNSLNYAVLNYASKYRKELLFNIYRMGKNSVEKGGKDHWSLSPTKIAVIDSAFNRAKRADEKLAKSRFAPKHFLDSLLQNENYKDPRGYIIPAKQRDMNTAIKFLTALSRNGIKIQQATADFQIDGKTYPKNSFIVKTNQAFRPHILDMFEAQDHPNDVEYPGGPPVAPYDAAGWTLAYLMHVEFDRMKDDFDGPFIDLPYGQDVAVLKHMQPKSKFLRLSARENDSFSYVNQLLQNKHKVYRDWADGDFYVRNDDATTDILHTSGLSLTAASALPKTAKLVSPIRIALWDTYGGSMPSGWLRLLFENFNYSYEVVFANDIDAGKLHEEFDLLVLVGNSVPSKAGSPSSPSTQASEMPSTIPDEYKQMWGRMSVDKSIPELEKFIKAGGHIVTIGNSDILATHLNVGVENALVDAEQKELSRTTFYTPGSVLTAKVNSGTIASLGYADYADIYFSNNRVYKIVDPSVKPILWFNNEHVLKSGWSLGEHYLKNGVIAFEKDIEKGKLSTFTSDIMFRGQTHGTFRLLFNQLYK